jgi:hypothetical protein
MIYGRIWEKYDRLRFPYFAVFRRIRSRTYTIVIRSYVLWAKYGRIRHRIQSFTTVYRVRNRRPGKVVSSNI